MFCKILVSGAAQDANRLVRSTSTVVLVLGWMNPKLVWHHASSPDGPGDENRHSPKAKQKSARYALHPFSALLLLLS